MAPLTRRVVEVERWKAVRGKGLGELLVRFYTRGGGDAE